jgi:hypothetical protein
VLKKKKKEKGEGYGERIDEEAAA